MFFLLLSLFLPKPKGGDERAAYNRLQQRCADRLELGEPAVDTERTD